MDELQQEIFDSNEGREERVRFTAQEIPAAIEAILFVSGDPVQVSRSRIYWTYPLKRVRNTWMNSLRHMRIIL